MMRSWTSFLPIALVGASLPPNLGDFRYIPGDPAPSFTIPLLGEEPLVYDANSKMPSKFLPFVVLVEDPNDPFVGFMTSSVDSIDGFLSDGPSGAHFLLGSVQAGNALQTKILARLALASDATQAAWAGQMHFLNRSDTAGQPMMIDDWLAQWPTPRSTIRTDDADHPRLDCRYASCSWPSEGQSISLTGADGPCGAGSFAGSFALVDLSESNCSAEDAARTAASNGAQGVVLIQRPAEMLAPVFETGPAFNGYPVSMVSAEAGASLLAAIGMSSTRSISATLASESGVGQFAAIDASGRIIEVGWEKYATLRMLTWQAQWLAYDKELRTKLAAPAFVVPIFDKQPQGTVAEVQMPPRSLVQQFGRMSLDFSLSCAGNMDRDCSVWDRIVSLTAHCEGSEKAFELGRWINAFQRRSGQWITETPLMPLLYPSGGNQRCNFSVDVGANNPWLVSLNLRFDDGLPEGGKGSMQAASAIPLVYPNPTENFHGPAYNENRTVGFSVPPGTSRVAVAAIITGHSGCEFQPTSHHFIINGASQDFSTLSPEYADRFMEAGSDFGCTEKVPRGAVPNNHGTWYFGRNGWCNGLDVKPLTFDVTGAVDFAAGVENTLRYQAFSYPVGQPSKPSEGGCAGNMRFSSYLVFYSDKSGTFFV